MESGFMYKMLSLSSSSRETLAHKVSVNSFFLMKTIRKTSSQSFDDDHLSLQRTNFENHLISSFLFLFRFHWLLRINLVVEVNPLHCFLILTQIQHIHSKEQAKKKGGRGRWRKRWRRKANSKTFLAGLVTPTSLFLLSTPSLTPPHFLHNFVHKI